MKSFLGRVFGSLIILIFMLSVFSPAVMATEPISKEVFSIMASNQIQELEANGTIDNSTKLLFDNIKSKACCDDWEASIFLDMFNEYEHVDLYISYLNGSYKYGSGSNYADAVIYNNNKKLDQFKNAKTVDEKIALLNHGASIDRIVNMINTCDGDDVGALVYAFDNVDFKSFNKTIDRYSTVANVIGDGASKTEGAFVSAFDKMSSEMSTGYLNYHYKVPDDEKINISNISHDGSNITDDMVKNMEKVCNKMFSAAATLNCWD
ncbi:MAG: hypothetical protein LBD03_03200 [Methanobrevibacter sp.]|nr:hypothetical protein [Candidatus Methanovirga procula]